MSAVSAWANTATATLWPLQSRAGWSGAQTFGAPVAIKCDYSSKARRLRDARGEEFTTNLTIYTERADIKPGDRVALGASTTADPIAAGALEVRAVVRQADTFDRKADDFEVSTAP